MLGNVCYLVQEEVREERDAKYTAVVASLQLTQEQEAAARQQVAALQANLATLTSEQEDLLVMLADQEEKKLAYRARLRELNVELSSDNEDEDLT